MAKRTPTLYLRGVYELKTPWVISASHVYECIAIRSFDDIYKLGKDVYKTYYESRGIDVIDFQTDVGLKANIVTLRRVSVVSTNDDQDIIYVPDTYILKYPDTGGVAYQHVILSTSLGAIPDTLDLDLICNRIANSVSETTGVTPTVNKHISATDGNVSKEQHDILEASRKAAVSNATSDYAQLLEMRSRYADLLVRYKALEQVIIDAGLIT